jgi:hypothetical protein
VLEPGGPLRVYRTMTGSPGYKIHAVTTGSGCGPPRTGVADYETAGGRRRSTSPPSWTVDGKALLISIPSDKGLGIFRATGDGKKTRITPEGVDRFK